MHLLLKLNFLLRQWCFLSVQLCVKPECSSVVKHCQSKNNCSFVLRGMWGQMCRVCVSCRLARVSSPLAQITSNLPWVEHNITSHGGEGKNSWSHGWLKTSMMTVNDSCPVVMCCHLSSLYTLELSPTPRENSQREPVCSVASPLQGVSEHFRPTRQQDCDEEESEPDCYTGG